MDSDSSYAIKYASNYEIDQIESYNDELVEITKDGRNAYDYITSFLNKYTEEQDIFTPVEMEELKTREGVLIKQSDTGYYRCK